jgi:hypothetical protein
MRYNISILILILSLFILSIPVHSYGHGGGHEKVPPEIIATPQVEDVMPELVDKMTESTKVSSETGLGEYDLGEEEPLSIQDSSHMMDDISSQDSHEGMDMTGDEHSGHEMKEVELATHELVSKSQKGYSAAMGITILAGLVFGFLTLKRPFE